MEIISDACFDGQMDILRSRRPVARGVFENHGGADKKFKSAVRSGYYAGAARTVREGSCFLLTAEVLG